MAGRRHPTILYLLEGDQRSHWHKVDGSELWLHQGGGQIRLLTYADGGLREQRYSPSGRPGRRGR